MIIEQGIITSESNQNTIEWSVKSGGIIEIDEILVSSERREGKGTRLLREMIEKINRDCDLDSYSVIVFTRAENRIAHLFYKANGFEDVGTIKQFYPDSDARLFILRVVR